MTSNALYFPYIRVPSNRWFTRVLLYNDRVASIVPTEFVENPDELGSYMGGLVREGLVTQILPAQELWKVPSFSSAFLQHLDLRGYRRFDRKEWIAIHAEKLSGTVDVHIEKMPDLVDSLVEMGLASRTLAKGYNPWVKVERRTANFFMAYLAAVLGQIPGNEKFTPTAEWYSHLSEFRNRSASENSERALVRDVILEGLLPSPEVTIEPAMLKEFKDENRDGLEHFRRFIEEKISDVIATSDQQRRIVRLKDVQGDLRESLDYLISRMELQRGWKNRIGFGSLCALGVVGVAVARTLESGDFRLGIPEVALGIAPVLYDAFRGAEEDFEARPLAYAAIAKKSFSL